LGQALFDFSQWNFSKRLVMNKVQPSRPSGYNYDAIVEWWFDDTAQLLLCINQTDVQTQLQNAIGALCNLQSSVFMATQVTHRRP
jgi:hypothetical protein